MGRSFTNMTPRFVITLLLAMQIWGQCPPPYVQVGNNCLFFATVGDVTYPEGHQLCQSADGELVTILTATKFKTIVDYINNNGLLLTSYWIDGSDEITEGVWVTSSGLDMPMGTPFWEASSTFQQPDNYQGIQHCVVLFSGSNLYLNDIGCATENTAICEIPSTENSDGTYVNKSIDCPTFYVDVGGKCLAFMTWVDASWESARGACIGLQGELATIDNIEQLREVYLYLKDLGLADHSFWLGGSDATEEGSWKWLDGSEVPMGTPFWGMHMGQEPTGGVQENCLSLLATGSHYFRDANCQNTIANPLCEYTG